MTRTASPDRDVIDELNGLLVQATRERSHYYTGSVIMKAIQEINYLRGALDQIAEATTPMSRPPSLRAKP